MEPIYATSCVILQSDISGFAGVQGPLRIMLIVSLVTLLLVALHVYTALFRRDAFQSYKLNLFDCCYDKRTQSRWYHDMTSGHMSSDSP